MPVNWNAELDKTLLLTCLEHHNITPKWSEIAPKLGPEFTAEAVRQRYQNMRRAHGAAAVEKAMATKQASPSMAKVHASKEKVHASKEKAHSSKEKVSPNKGELDQKSTMPTVKKPDFAGAKKRKFKNVEDNEELANDNDLDEEATALKTPTRPAKSAATDERSYRYKVAADEDEE